MIKLISFFSLSEMPDINIGQIHHVSVSLQPLIISLLQGCLVKETRKEAVDKVQIQGNESRQSTNYEEALFVFIQNILQIFEGYQKNAPILVSFKQRIFCIKHWY